MEERRKAYGFKPLDGTEGSVEERWKIDARGLIEEVEKETGLSEWDGRDNIINTLAIGLKCMNEISMPVIPSFIPNTIATVKRILATRLKMIQQINATPSISSIPITAPVFIIGNGRTGSTLLQQLLAQDPLTRSPLFWEMVHPVGDKSKEEKIEISEAFIQQIKEKCPVFYDMHPYISNEPEECTEITAYDLFYLPWTMLLPAFPKLFYMQSFSRHLDLFKFHKQGMQLIEHNNPHPETVHWTFKSPLHTGFIRAIKQVYPDAKFIMLHRDPSEVLSSTVALIQAYNSIAFPPEVQAAMKPALAKAVLKNNVDSHFLFMFTREKMKDVGKDIQVVHCRYENLIKDPSAEIERIYKELGRGYTPEFHNRIKEKLAESTKRQKKSTYSHSLEGTGLTKEEIDQEFAKVFSAYLLNR